MAAQILEQMNSIKMSGGAKYQAGSPQAATTKPDPTTNPFADQNVEIRLANDMNSSKFSDDKLHDYVKVQVKQEEFKKGCLASGLGWPPKGLKDSRRAK
ncbi:hypothetical protein DL769_003645 [Monosporascus sp. CRB-8-3]|nr:hypothetical protein DL769_003645 [Monosporascus sp. CRB-8-3]